MNKKKKRGKGRKRREGRLNKKIRRWKYCILNNECYYWLRLWCDQNVFRTFLLLWYLQWKKKWWHNLCPVCSQIAAALIHCCWTSSSSCSSSESAQSHRLKQLFPVKGGFSSNERVVRRETSWKIILGVAVLVTQVGLLVTGWVVIGQKKKKK